MDPLVVSDFNPGATLSSSSDRTKQVGDGVMGKDEFLKLLVSQLSNQDPMNPMDGQEFAAQLAQFTSVEQLMNISTSLAESGEMNALLAQSVNSGVAAGLIGKSVESAGNSFNFDGEEPATLKFRLDDTAAVVKVTIKNASGETVREVELTGRAAGDHEYEWNGDDAEGDRAPGGAFTYEVLATTEAGDVVESETFMRGKVDRVSFGQDGIMLWIGKVKVPMSSVESVE